MRVGVARARPGWLTSHARAQLAVLLVVAMAFVASAETAEPTKDFEDWATPSLLQLEQVVIPGQVRLTAPRGATGRALTQEATGGCRSLRQPHH
jgi:hypothetical protein